MRRIIAVIVIFMLWNDHGCGFRCTTPHQSKETSE